MCWAASYSHNPTDKLIKKIHVTGIEYLDYMLHRFWEIESEGTNTQSMTVDEKKVVKLVQDSMQYKDGQYEVRISWKRDPECLPDNYDIAVKRMMNTERKLLRDDKIANSATRLLKVISTKVMSKFWTKILKLKVRNGIFHTL